MQVIFAIVWFFAGCILSIPYTFLANGNFDEFILTAWISPVGAFILFIQWRVMKLFKRSTEEKGSGYIFLILIMYFCIPIFFNNASIFCRWINQKSLAETFFSIRYKAMILIPFFLLVIVFITELVADILHQKKWEKLKTK